MVQDIKNLLEGSIIHSGTFVVDIYIVFCYPFRYVGDVCDSFSLYILYPFAPVTTQVLIIIEKNRFQLLIYSFFFNMSSN